MKLGKNKIKQTYLTGFILLVALWFTALQAQIPCTEVTQQSGIDHHYLSVTYMGGGAAFFDFDNDNDEDLWIVGGINQDVLYENDGSGNFTEIGTAAGLEATNGHITSGVITADLDNDGFRDVITLGHIGFHPQLFKNNGDGTFEEISDNAGLSNYEGQSFAAACGDVNQDGLLDIYVGTYIENIQLIYDNTGAVVGFDHDCFNNFLFINNGDWTFTEMAQEYEVRNGGCALATTFTDFDQDADSDLLIANDFGEWLTPNSLYENNNPSGPFPNVSQATGMDIGIYGMGIAIGDYDRDQDLDYYVTNLGTNILMENQGDNTFLDKALETGTEDTYVNSLLATGWGTAFIDIDNDTDLDLFVCNGYVPSAMFISNNPFNKNRLFINEGNAAGTGYTFFESAFESSLDDPGRGRGFTYADYDNDGDLDFLVVNVNQQTTSDSIQNVLLYRNDNNNGNNWLKVKLQGITSNRDAFGSSIKIVVGEHSWIHDYNGGYGSHASQHASSAHFGLGENTVVDSLLITWPGGVQHAFTQITSNQMICISENGTITDTRNVEIQDDFLKASAYPNPFTDQTQIKFNLQNADELQINIYDALGRIVHTFEEKQYTQGEHILEWNNKHSQSSWYILQIKSKQTLTTLKLLNIN